MRNFVGIVTLVTLVLGSSSPAFAKTNPHRRHANPEKKPGPNVRRPEEVEAATRLQIFLDRANFAPGRLDGHYGDFTLKALNLYRQSRGEQPAPPPAKPDTAPDLNGLDLAAITPVFVPYTVTEADMQMVGPLPAGVPEQAKLKVLPYRDLPEALGEKFHSDPRFIDEINQGKLKAAKVGDQLLVPNVEPFDLGRVKEIKPGSDATPQGAANEMPDEPAKPGEDKKDDAVGTGPITVKVDQKSNMVGVFEGDKIVACYPVTIGSAQTQSPVGEWKIKGFAKMPNFRYDEQMLNHGERSKNFHMLAPGPNNPVGVMWIALNKKGIGLHGTAEPDTIGRSVSHGCVRLANWDIVRLAGKVKAGVPVSIH